MLRIGQFSKLGKITVKTLRYYDKIGLLKPAMIDSSSSYRYYTVEQLQTLHLISAYKAAGLSNELILKLMDKKDDERALLEYQRVLLLQRAKEIQDALSGLDALLANKETQAYTACVKEVPRRVVFCCQGYVASVACIHDFIKASVGELAKTNPDVRPSEPDYCCVIYPDDGYRESNIFIEYVQSVDRVGKNTDTLKFKEIEEITAVSVLHHGSYDTLKDAYLFAVNWAKDNGYTLSGEPRERYINGAWNREQVSEWLTELQLPVKKETL